MFPEVSTSVLDTISPFSKAAFQLSFQTNLKIVPIIQKLSKANITDEIQIKVLSPIEKQWFESIDDFRERAFELMKDELEKS